MIELNFFKCCLYWWSFSSRWFNHEISMYRNFIHIWQEANNRLNAQTSISYPTKHFWALNSFSIAFLQYFIQMRAQSYSKNCTFMFTVENRSKSASSAKEIFRKNYFVCDVWLIRNCGRQLARHTVDTG